MNRMLNTLDPPFKPIVFEFLARLTEARIPVVIVNTWRTAEEQAALLKAGASWVAHSKHEDGLAIDICPYAIYTLYGSSKLNWNANDPIWERIARIGESLGLDSGYRWKQRDCGHFELPYDLK